MSRLNKTLTYAAFGFSLLLPFTSFAHSNNPCKADKDKFCANVQKGSALQQCMKEHHDELSAECKQKLEQKKAQHKANSQTAQ